MSDRPDSHDAQHQQDEKSTASAIEQQESSSSERLERASNLLDFAKMDLEVDTIDERISPSETNVFDK